MSLRLPRRLAVIGALALIGVAARGDSFRWRDYAGRPDSWFAGPEAARKAENILSHQSDRGSWPKNIDTSAAPYDGDRSKIRGTFDNGATTGELRFLARVDRATGRPRHRGAFLKGLDHILAAQYPNGGWPQSYPPGEGYHRHITFNDGAMVHLMEFLREVARDGEYDFVDAMRRRAAGRAFDAGIRCILDCQVIVDGVPTAWCAQHDEVTLMPAKGRAYEHPSLSGAESAGILALLMSLDDPSPRVRRAVHAGSRWFDRVRITGIRVERRDGDAAVVADPGAPPLWARFYEIGTDRPIFSGRDGVIRGKLAEIERERRAGYAWYGRWGEDEASRYRRWCARWDGAPRRD
ncbi:Pectic acid lyase [Aquisphaera giovannonii]|uniref:Pectic acid lyase n=1 Tax=Aquisphaera giovannonii TaxID=406548 RepID=A0A5B9VV14_9BACT|nr:pectate lyase [Aquisphaera giovannonii]QEH31934.1 Pectic acid lyase [Aquisphaera giovannonii]